MLRERIAPEGQFSPKDDLEPEILSGLEANEATEDDIDYFLALVHDRTGASKDAG